MISVVRDMRVDDAADVVGLVREHDPADHPAGAE